MTYEETNQKILKRVLYTQSKSGNTAKMTRNIRRICSDLGAKVWIHEGNVYAVKGNAEFYPCVVAHTDTVHDIVPQSEYRVVFEKGRYFAYNPKTDKPTGVGGDDKVGIYIALSALQRFDAIKVVFFKDEEIGCRGAALADVDFFKDVGYIFECDRQGKDDFVTRIGGKDLCGYQFENKVRPILTSYKYKTGNGNSTDVGRLKDLDIDIAMANMSCGYYSPHSASEYVVRDDMMSTRDMVFELIDFLGQNKYEHKRIKYTTQASTYSYGAYNPQHPKYWEKDKRENAIAAIKDGLPGVRFAYRCDHCDSYMGMFPNDPSQREEIICDDCLKVHEGGTKEPLSLQDYVSKGHEGIDDVVDYMENVAGKDIFCPTCKQTGMKYDPVLERFFCQGCFEFISFDEDDDEAARERSRAKRQARQNVLALPEVAGNTPNNISEIGPRLAEVRRANANEFNELEYCGWW